MKFNGILSLVVTVLIVVLISTAAIVPIVQAAQDDQRTEVQNSNERFRTIESADDFTISKSGSMVTIGTKTYDTNVNNYGLWFISDQFAVVGGGSGQYPILQVYDTVNKITFSLVANQILTFSGNTITYTYNNTDYSVDFTNGFVVSEAGTKGIWYDFSSSGSKTIYVDEGKPVEFITKTTTGIFFDIMYDPKTETTNVISAYRADSENANVLVALDPSEYTLTPAVFTETDLGYSYNSYGTIISYNGTDYRPFSSVDLTYHILTNDDTMIIAMLGIIPTLLFVVPIMIIVRHFNVGRD